MTNNFKEDYYNLLECSPNATYKELKSSYQRLALLYHPDKNNGNLEKFIGISSAWKILQNYEKRNKYDAEKFQRICSQISNKNEVNIKEFNYSELRKYTYDCRCGGVYSIDEIELNNSFDLECSDCSLNITVKT